MQRTVNDGGSPPGRHVLYSAARRVRGTQPAKREWTRVPVGRVVLTSRQWKLSQMVQDSAMTEQTYSP